MSCQRCHSWVCTCPRPAIFIQADPSRNAVYAEAEYNSWEPQSLAYRAFCNGCAYCIHGQCTMQMPEHKLNWE